MQGSSPEQIVYLTDVRMQRRQRVLARLDHLLRPSVVEAVLELIDAAETERQA